MAAGDKALLEAAVPALTDVIARGIPDVSTPGELKLSRDQRVGAEIYHREERVDRRPVEVAKQIMLIHANAQRRHPPC